MLELWMVRHGETDWNIEGKVQGWTDIPLNDTGLSQAEKLANYISGVPFQAVISSDLARARRTATILNTEIGAAFSVNSLLRERCFGSAEGMLRTDMFKLYPDGAPDAESEAEIALRAQKFLAEISALFDSGRILCVSHGGFIRALLAFLGHTVESGPTNTSVSKLIFHEGVWSPATVNWSGHLTETEKRPPVTASGRLDVIKSQN